MKMVNSRNNCGNLKDREALKVSDISPHSEQQLRNTYLSIIKASPNKLRTGLLVYLLSRVELDLLGTYTYPFPNLISFLVCLDH